MALVRTHHNIYDTHYHLVFPIKYRKSLLTDDIPQAINQISNEISERYDITFEKLGYDQNHIHILCSFPPKYSGSTIVRIFKSITARELFRQFPKLKRELWGGELWSDGFYLATVSDKGNWQMVERYVANQGKTSDQPLQLRLLT